MFLNKIFKIDLKYLKTTKSSDRTWNGEKISIINCLKYLDFDK